MTLALFWGDTVLVPTKVSINGEILDPEEARISVFDRGFLYGDSVYETLRVYGWVPFALEEHLERLRASGRAIGFDLPWSTDDLRQAVGRLVQVACMADARVRVMATRGRGTFGLDPALAADPQLVILVMELQRLPKALYEQGLSARVVAVPRNLRQALDPAAKTGNYMNSILALREAREAGDDEAIMLNHQGRVAEASSANVFALLAGIWCTPPLEVGILPGITRRVVLAFCEREAIACEERSLSPGELASATEVFLCSSIREILPVVRLNGVAVGDGCVGPGVRRLRQLYAAEIRAQALEAG